jgi:hypothetical protein
MRRPRGESDIVVRSRPQRPRIDEAARYLGVDECGAAVGYRGVEKET